MGRLATLLREVNGLILKDRGWRDRPPARSVCVFLLPLLVCTDSPVKRGDDETGMAHRVGAVHGGYRGGGLFRGLQTVGGDAVEEIRNHGGVAAS